MVCFFKKNTKQNKEGKTYIWEARKCVLTIVRQACLVTTFSSAPKSRLGRSGLCEPAPSLAGCRAGGGRPAPWGPAMPPALHPLGSVGNPGGTNGCGGGGSRSTPVAGARSQLALRQPAPPAPRRQLTGRLQHQCSSGGGGSRLRALLGKPMFPILGCRLLLLQLSSWYA